MEGKAEASRDADELDPLALTLGSIYAAAAAAAAAPASPPPPPPPTVAPRAARRRLNNGTAPIYAAAAAPASPPPPVAPRAVRRRVNRVKPRADAGDLLVQAPFPWATERPAQHGTLESLLRRGVTSVEGHARCKRCGATKAIAYDLETKFWEVREYIVTNRHAMYDRAPKAWEFPPLPDCDACGHRGAMWPEIAADKHEINWLFLFLGQMLGCCTLDQLKYFCMNNGRHRTGAKNRVLYYAYIEMSNQLLSFD